MVEIKQTNYNMAQKQLKSLIEDEHNLVILSNASALINDNLDQVN